MHPEKIAVIGSNSFSGATFVRYLLDNGQHVLGFSRSLEPEDVFLPYKWSDQYKEKYTFYKADLNHDLEKLVDIIHSEKPDYIVNFAALGMVAQSWEKPEDWYQTNVVAQVKFHDQLREMVFLEKYIHVTTPEVYGSTDGWKKEDYSFEIIRKGKVVSRRRFDHFFTSDDILIKEIGYLHTYRETKLSDHSPIQINLDQII